MRVFLALVLSVCASVAVADDLESVAGSILVHGHTMDYERALTDEIGPRLTGSDSYDRAAQWAAEQFRTAGVRKVTLEPVTVDRGWQRGTVHARMSEPYAHSLHVMPLAWTAAATVSGPIAIVQQLTPDWVRAHARELDAHVAMVSIGTAFKGGFFNSYFTYLDALSALKAAGARALLLSQNNADNALSAFPAVFTGDAPLPMAVIGMEDGKMIERLLAKQPVVVDYSYDARLTPGRTTWNVVAEIPGSDHSGEWIAVGAHLDSWDLGTGAQDNGTGAAMVLESARAIAALGHAPRRTIRFFLWTGEEEGFLGSHQWAAAHAADLAKCVASLNTDAGAGHPIGWSSMGRTDVADAVRPLAKSLLTDLGGGQVNDATEFILQSDHAFFLLAGVPVLELTPDMAHYFDIHHRSSDTLDKVDAHNLATNAAIVAVTALAIANREQPIAPHQDAAATKKLLEKANVYEWTKKMGWVD